MAEKPALIEMIVSQLGTTKESFGLGDALFIAVLIGALAAYLALEWGAGRLIFRLCRRVRKQAQEHKKASGSDRT